MSRQGTALARPCHTTQKRQHPQQAQPPSIPTTMPSPYTYTQTQHTRKKDTLGCEPCIVPFANHPMPVAIAMRRSGSERLHMRKRAYGEHKVQAAVQTLLGTPPQSGGDNCWCTCFFTPPWGASVHTARWSWHATWQPPRT